MSGVIYVLRDPRTKVIRYVGFTTKAVWRRVKGHIAEAKSWRSGVLSDSEVNRLKNEWLLELLDAGLSPEFDELLRGVTSSEAQNFEFKAIDVLTKHGADLTNRRRGTMQKLYRKAKSITQRAPIS